MYACVRFPIDDRRVCVCYLKSCRTPRASPPTYLYRFCNTKRMPSRWIFVPIVVRCSNFLNCITCARSTALSNLIKASRSSFCVSRWDCSLARTSQWKSFATILKEREKNAMFIWWKGETERERENSRVRRRKLNFFLPFSGDSLNVCACNRLSSRSRLGRERKRESKRERRISVKHWAFCSQFTSVESWIFIAPSPRLPIHISIIPRKLCTYVYFNLLTLVARRRSTNTHTRSFHP